MSDAMHDAVFAFDVSDEEPTLDYAWPERQWAVGTQPLLVERDLVDEYSRAQEDDLVQVMFDDDGVWHRQAIALPETPCGRLHKDAIAIEHRASSYAGRICTEGCFSKHEIDVIAPRLRERERVDTERMRKLTDERDEKDRERRRLEREEMREALKRGEMPNYLKPDHLKKK